MTAVLLASDADWIYDEVDAALGDEGTVVYRVRAGRDVPVAVERTDADVVILDMQIGNAGGVATALNLRQDEDMGRTRRRAILVLLDRGADVFMAQMARADGWLVKPLDSFRLRRATDALLADQPYFEGMAEATT